MSLKHTKYKRVYFGLCLYVFSKCRLVSLNVCVHPNDTLSLIAAAILEKRCRKSKRVERTKSLKVATWENGDDGQRSAPAGRTSAFARCFRFLIWYPIFHCIARTIFIALSCHIAQIFDIFASSNDFLIDALLGDSLEKIFRQKKTNH